MRSFTLVALIGVLSILGLAVGGSASLAGNHDNDQNPYRIRTTGRHLTAFTPFSPPITPTTEWPEDPENLDGWIDYGSFVLIGFAIPFILGCFLTLYMMIYCCCVKCCSNCTCKSFSPDNKRLLVIGYSVFYFVFLLLGILGIGLTAVTSTNLNDSLTSVKKFANDTPTAINQISADLDTVGGQLFTLVDEVSDDLSEFSFTQVNNLLDQIDVIVADLRGGISSINGSLAALTNSYSNLTDSYYRLQELARDGKISDAPGNSTLRNPSEENEGSFRDALQKFDESSESLRDIRQTINETQNEFIRERDEQVDNLKSEFDNVMGDVQASVSQIANDLSRSFSPQMIEEMVDPYITMQNQIRMGIIIGLVALNLLAFFVFFVGIFRKIGCLTELPYWFAVFTLWWIVFIAAVHFVIYVPVRDVCDKGVPYLQSPGVSSLLQGIVTNAGSGEGTDIFAALAQTLLDNPYSILHCPPNDTFLNRLDISITSYIPGLDDSLASFRETFLDATDSINANETIAQAREAFDVATSNVTTISNNIGVYQSEADAVLGQVRNVSNLLGDSIDATYTAMLDKLNDLNAITSSCAGLMYDLNNYTTINPNGPPYLVDCFPSERTEIGDIKSALETLDANRNDTITTRAEVESILASMNATFTQIIREAGLLGQTIDMIVANLTSGGGLVDGLASLQTTFITYALDIVESAVAQVRDLLGLKTVGSCGFIGEFWTEGIEHNVCTRTKGAVGGAAVVLFLFALMMAAVTPILLQAKWCVSDRAGKSNIRDDDL